MKRMMWAGAVTAVALRLLLPLRQLCGLPTCPKGNGSCCKRHESWSRVPLPLTSRHRRLHLTGKIARSLICVAVPCQAV